MGHRDLLFCDPTYRTATDADSWHALASAAQRLRPNLYFTYPIKEDVKKKVFSSPLAGDIDVWLASSRVSLLEGLLIFPLGLAAISSGEPTPVACPDSPVSYNGGARRLSVPKLRKQKRWFRCQPRSYVRLEAYSFFGLSEGHRIDPETRC